MSLKTFLQNRSNANIFEMANNHMQKVLETVVEFERGFSIYINEKNVELAAEIFKRVDRLEHEADIIRRDILVQISKSELTTQMREDLSHLVKRIDRIANTTDGAARRLIGLNPDHVFSLGEPVLKKSEEIVSRSIEATKVLYKLIKNLPQMEDKETFRICEKIQSMEHDVDVLHSQLYELMNKLETLDFNAFVALQICNFVDMLEMISDKVEDVSDYIEILKTAKRTTE